MQNNVVLGQHDPRRLSAHPAPMPPPLTHQIAEEQRSRFSADGSRTFEDPDQTIDYIYTQQ